uniref:Uncharacterized protein n=1 Tax=Salix viminalis TaxID=40686 RepID=A0A6N2NIA0_SALVM
MKGKDWSFYKVCNSNNDKGQNRKTLSFPNQTRRSSIFSQKPYHSPTRTLLSQPHLSLGEFGAFEEIEALYVEIRWWDGLGGYFSGFRS